MKIFIMLLYLIGTTSAAQAQTTYYTLTIATAQLDIATNEWIWTTPRKTRMMITMEGNNVYIDNNAKTKLHMISAGKTMKLEGGRITIYDAIDQNKNLCTWSIASWDDHSPNTLYLSYTNVRAAYRMSLE